MFRRMQELRVGVIGLNGRGMDHVGAFAGLPGVTVAALCDPDEATWGRALAELDKRGKPKPATYQDLRRLLDDKTVDAVSIATPNHWHALAAYWAMAAGKHVYVEKPVSHNFLEGRTLILAQRKFGKICQGGTQCRSNPGMIEAMEYLHSGALGKVKIARGLCYKLRLSIGKGAGRPPASADYDLWLGPAPNKPMARQRFHYDWHWFWDYGNGDLGNQGVHQVDIARWGLKKNSHPRRVSSIGGRLGYEDDGETPNTQIVWCDYGDSELIFEVRGLPADDYQGAKIGVVFHCEGGTMVVPSYDEAKALDPAGKEIRAFKGGANHYKNFVDAIRENKPSLLTSPIEEGHYSSAICHAGNISYRLGVKGGLELDRFNGSKREGMERMSEHLSKALSGKPYEIRYGRELTIDARNETFGRDREANDLLFRDYRAPYILPRRP